MRQIDLGRSSAWNLLGLCAPVPLALVCIPVLIKNLGYERFGLLSVLWTTVGYAGLFDLGLGRALNLEVSRCISQSRHGDLPRVVAAGLMALALIGFGFGLLCALLSGVLANLINASPRVHAELQASLVVLGCAIPIAVLGSGLVGTLEGMGRFDRSNVSRIVVAIITFLGTTSISRTTTSLVVAAAVLLTARCVAFVAVGVWVRSELMGIGSAGAVAASHVKEFIRSGRWLMLSNMLSPALGYGDRLVVAFAVPATAIAYYTTPYEMVTKILIAASAVTTSLFPAVSRNAHDGGALVQLLRRALLMVASTVVPAALTAALFARAGLAWWIGADFAGGAFRVTQVLCIGVACNAIGAIAFSALQGLGHARAILRVHLWELPLYAGALVLSAKFQGVLGVASVWAIRTFADAILLWILTIRLRQALSMV